MEYEDDSNVEPISIAHYREILGADADDLSDAEVEQIRRHAETVANTVISLFVAQRSSLQ